MRWDSFVFVIIATSLHTGEEFESISKILKETGISNKYIAFVAACFHSLLPWSLNKRFFKIYASEVSSNVEHNTTL